MITSKRVTANSYIMSMDWRRSEYEDRVAELAAWFAENPESKSKMKSDLGFADSLLSNFFNLNKISIVTLWRIEDWLKGGAV